MEEKKDCQSHCSHHSCSGCGEMNDLGCPMCGQIGLEVPYETVVALSKPFFTSQLETFKNESFYLCIHPGCKVAYYTLNEGKLLIDQITVPIWFKREKSEYKVCYCRDINLDDIKQAVINMEGEITKQSIIKYLDKEKVETDCLHKNPTGKCCERLFINAIDYCLKNKDVNN